MHPINFFQEETDFEFKNTSSVTNWIIQVISDEGYTVGGINYIFCSDPYILQINKQYLNHNYYTDIITFDNSEGSVNILADIFISIDRVRENATRLEITFNDELHRVMVHGLLHLMGYGDKNKNEKILMRQKEDACLSLLK